MFGKQHKLLDDHRVANTQVVAYLGARQNIVWWWWRRRGQNTAETRPPQKRSIAAATYPRFNTSKYASSQRHTNGATALDFPLLPVSVVASAGDEEDASPTSLFAGAAGVTPAGPEGGPILCLRWWLMAQPTKVSTDLLGSTSSRSATSSLTRASSSLRPGNSVSHTSSLGYSCR